MLKKTCFGCFKLQKIRDNDNETGLMEGGGIEILTTVLSIYTRMHCSLFAFVLLLTS